MLSTESWFSLLCQTLLRGAGWLLLLLLLAPLLKKRLSAARRALGWQMAFVGLIVLPLMLLWTPPLPLLHRTPLSAADMRIPSVRRQPAPISFPMVSRARPAVRLSARPDSYPIGIQTPSITVASSAETTGSGFRWAGLPAILILCWGVGAGCFLVRLFVGLATLRRIGRYTVEATAELSDEARDDASRLGLRHPVGLRIASQESRLKAPITWGIARPIVLLPADYGRETKDRCRAALLHELAHVQRRDWLWLLLAQSLCALYWCVPFVWMAARRLSHETELACDDCVLTAGISAPDYADQIMEVVRKMQSDTRQLPLIALPMARLPLAEARIRAILDTTRHRQSTSRSVLAVAALLPALCVPLLSLRVVAAQENRPAHPGATPAAPALTAPSSSEVSLLAIDPVPLTISKSASQPALPSVRPANLDGDAPRPTVGRQPAPAIAPAITVAGPPNNEQPAIAWGPVVDGLQAGLRLVGVHGTVFAPGEPIWQEAYLRNNSPAEVIISAIGGYESQGAPLITSAKGARVKVLRYFGFGMMFVESTRVGPGEIALVGRFAVAFNGTVRPKEVAPGLSAWAEETALALTGPGAYTLAQELSPLDAHDKPLKKTLRTGAIPIEIGNLPPVEIRRLNHNQYADLATAPIAWGPVHDGLQTGLFYLGSRSEFFVGEHVRVAVVLRNVSKIPITFWHETSFASMETPQVTDAAGKPRTVTLAPETEWKTVSSIRMTGVTFDMTSAPSADGPSHLHQSEIAPGQSILGYCVAGFVLPARWKDGQAVPGRYHLIQPLRIGLGNEEQLDTILDTGALEMVVSDPNGVATIR